MHVLPDLKRLEQKYRDELVVIGVHSAKFHAERDTENIRQAILRYEIEHPVVNDQRRCRSGRSTPSRAWPTLVLIDPKREGDRVAFGRRHLRDVRQGRSPRSSSTSMQEGALDRAAAAFPAGARAASRIRCWASPARFWPTPRAAGCSSRTRITTGSSSPRSPTADVLEIIGAGERRLARRPFRGSRTASSRRAWRWTAGFSTSPIPKTTPSAAPTWTPAGS